jgi:hypothetical protein
MSTDIHSRAERRNSEGKWESVWFSPFDWQAYGMYGFLANVRNYSDVPPLAQPRGLPADLDAGNEDLGDHSFSWLSLSELLSFEL